VGSVRSKSWCCGERIQDHWESKTIGNPNRYVVPLGSHYFGKTYGQWSAAYWKWVLSITIPNNPILDTEGINGGVGQSGGVWFLAGTNGVTGVNRTVKIPAEKAIFVPIINAVSFPYPKLDVTDPELKKEVRDFINNVTVHKVELDGKNLDSFRVKSDIFMFTVPENNYLNLCYPNLTARSYQAESDGYWIMLKPLPEGIHNIRIYGKVKYPDGSYKTETGVDYKIIVKSKKH
jgi:hypothetical protein